MRHLSKGTGLVFNIEQKDPICCQCALSGDNHDSCVCIWDNIPLNLAFSLILVIAQYVSFVLFASADRLCWASEKPTVYV